MLSVRLVKRRGDFLLDVAFEAAGTGVVALFGRSGCGKSTAVSLLAGLLRPDEGRVTFDGEVLFDSTQGVDIPAERRGIGCVFQDARLFPHLTVRGNLGYGLRRAADRRQRFGFDGVVDLLGIRELLQRRPHQLSGGEKQRVAIGRALLSQPRLLLLDEPLAALDLARREELLPYLERVRDELHIPMLYISHQFDEVVRLATQVVLLDRGQVLADGDLAQMSLRPELRSLVGAEAIGSVVEGTVMAVDGPSGLAEIGVGTGGISVDAVTLQPGQRVRLQLLARDLLLAIERPRGLSVRNVLQGSVTRVEADGRTAVLVTVDVGGPRLIARVTAAAARELELVAGRPAWVLVKAVTLRGHVFRGAAP